jgi:ribose transport system ATP-binding protein
MNMGEMWRLEGLTKSFGPIKAVEDFTCSLEEGRIYGLVGGNGAGKSTLVRLVTGVLKPDRGRILKEGKELVIRSPKDARRYGIAAAYQEFSLVPDLPVINNLLLNIEPTKLGFIDIDRMIDKVAEFMDKLGVNIPLDKLVRELSPSEKQVVEIAKSLILEPQLLFLDEPTNYLSEEQREELFKTMIEIKNNARTTIVFISHRIEEVFRVSDQAIVLRNGRLVDIYDLGKVSMDEVVKAMVGELAEEFRGYKYVPKATVEAVSGKPVISVRNLSVNDKVKNVSLDVGRGEIVGLAGLLGQGQSEFLRAIYGLLPYEGAISLEGRDVKINSPRDALKHGIVYVSGDTLEGVFLLRSIRENISLILNLWRGLHKPVLSKLEKEHAVKMIKKLNIACRDPDQPVLYLSGGNRQKVYLARGLTVNPKVLLLDDPLKGVDIRAKKEILNIVKELAGDKAVLFFSSDIKELLPIVDRVLVFFEGRVIREFKGEELREDLIMEASIKGTAG